MLKGSAAEKKIKPFYAVGKLERLKWITSSRNNSPKAINRLHNYSHKEKLELIVSKRRMGVEVGGSFIGDSLELKGLLPGSQRSLERRSRSPESTEIMRKNLRQKSGSRKFKMKKKNQIFENKGKFITTISKKSVGFFRSFGYSSLSNSQNSQKSHYLISANSTSPSSKSSQITVIAYFAAIGGDACAQFLKNNLFRIMLDFKEHQILKMLNLSLSQALNEYEEIMKKFGDPKFGGRCSIELLIAIDAKVWVAVVGAGHVAMAMRNGNTLKEVRIQQIGEEMK